MPDVDGGKTVRIILRGCRVQLSSRDFLEWAIVRLCDHMGMTRIGTPMTRCIAPGFSTVLVIAESHIAMHTWPETESVRIVIDSCVDFDHEAVAQWLKGVYEADDYTQCGM